MTAKQRALVQLHLADGSAISSWTKFTLRRRYDDPLESFSFDFAPTKPERDRLFALTKKGRAVSISIEGAPQATCVIVDTKRSLNSSGLQISIEARGLLAAAYAASVDPFLAKSTQADSPLKNVILDVLRPFGFTTIEVDTSADVTAMSGKSLSGRKDPVVLDDLKQKDILSNVGLPAYGFCARLFNRYALVLSTNNQGKLLLGSPDFEQEAAYACVEDAPNGRKGDRMLLEDGIDETDSNEGMFSEVIVTGKASGSAKGTKTATTPEAGIFAPPNASDTRPTGIPFANAKLATLTPGRHTYSSDLQPFKPKYWTDKKSHDRVRCESLATLMHGQRAASAYQLKCSVEGLISASGQRIWTVDTVGHIYSATLGIDEPMWLYAVEQSQDTKGGQKTKLTWIPLNSLVLGSSG